MSDRTPHHALIVMGVSGSGKSTIAAALAERLQWTFRDGDSFHPASNVAKMSAGQPLTDEDRWPWLQAIADEIARTIQDGGRLIVACSALKRVYRSKLTGERDDVTFVYLDGSRELILSRLGARKDHFMPTTLLDSQFVTLEPPAPDENAITVPIDGDVGSIVSDITGKLAPDMSARTKRTAL